MTDGQTRAVAQVLAGTSTHDWWAIEVNGWGHEYLAMAEQTIAAAVELDIDVMALAGYEATVRASERENAAGSVEQADAHLRRICGDGPDHDDLIYRVHASLARAVRDENWLDRAPAS